MNPSRLQKLFNAMFEIAKHHFRIKDYRKVREIYELMKLHLDEAMRDLELLQNGL